MADVFIKNAIESLDVVMKPLWPKKGTEAWYLNSLTKILFKLL